jgi:hypothetical protein
MPPARRPRVSSRLPSTSSAAAADGRGGKGWLSTLRRDPAKRPRRADDEGTPLNDEVLLVIFAGVHNLADLVRCAATCRRWRRLVSTEAAFLCRTPRLVPARFIGPLALGFFHHRVDAAPGFVAMASALRRFPGLLQDPPPSLGALDDNGLFDGSSRIVAARNGLLVVDIRHGKQNRALKLCVCNPMTGEVHVLPPLAGKDGLGHYSCTVLTAEDRDDKTTDPPPPPSYFRLVMVYTRRGFTAFRSYSSDEGSWSEEAKVTGSRLGKKQMGLTHSGVVSRDGKLVYWMAKNVVLVLSLNKLQSMLGSMPRSGNGQIFDMKNTLLGLSPKGRLCAVQFDPLPVPARMKADRISIRITNCTTDRRWFDEIESIQVGQSLPDDVISLKLKWFCSKSGIVFFTAVAGDSGHQRREVYALNLNTRVVEKLACHDGVGDPWEGLHGYEMDQVAYLASLAEPDSLEDM